MIREIYKEEYPITLKNMKSPPNKLQVRGQFGMPQDQKYLCIVGSRSWTSYGQESVHSIISGLKGYPISIVSGLAYGIDSISHVAALEAGLHCIAFPGSSLEWDQIYPPEHVGLAQTIVERGGALVSEWEPGYPTGKWTFPARNRLMAGLSHAVLIIEAAHKSGSLMTAKYAEDFDRDVLAVPGPIDSPQSYGPHMLIRRGAALISSSFDVLEALGFEVERPTYVGKKKPGRRKPIPVHIREDMLAMSIMEMLKPHSMTMDQLTEAMNAPVQTMNEKLTILELEGLVRIEGTRIKSI